MEPCLLPQLAVLKIGGADRSEFLQGQLTQDMSPREPPRAVLWGWNNPRGRLLAIGQAIPRAEDILLVLPQELLATTAARLKMFVLRAQVSIEPADLAVAGLASDGAACEFGGLTLAPSPGACSSEAGLAMARVWGDPSRALLICPTHTTGLQSSAGEAERWELADVRAGLPSISAATSEAFVPQMVNLDLVGGIDFTKGCYVGQEVVARTQNLGRIKRRMFRFAATRPLPAGTTVDDESGARVGTVVRRADASGRDELLAVVQLSAVRESLRAAGEELQPLELPYAIPD